MISLAEDKQFHIMEGDKATKSRFKIERTWIVEIIGGTLDEDSI